MGNRGAAAPGPPLDDETSRPCRDVERLRCTAPCRHGPDAMLSRAPRHLSQQPRTRRRRLEKLRLCLGNGRQADKPLLETEGPAACEMPAADLEQSRRRRQVKPTGIPSLGLADAALIQMEAVIQPKGLNLQFDIVDFHDRRLHMRKGDIAPGLPPTLDQSTFDQLRQRLVHSHTRATILLGQLVLERDTVARRPRAGENMTFHIPEDSLVQRKRLRLVARFVGWLIARNVGTLNGLLLPASLNISQLRDSPPLTLSCFSTKASQPPHYHGNAAACVIGAGAAATDPSPRNGPDGSVKGTCQDPPNRQSRSSGSHRPTPAGGCSAVPRLASPAGDPSNTLYFLAFLFRFESPFEAECSLPSPSWLKLVLEQETRMGS